MLASFLYEQGESSYIFDLRMSENEKICDPCALVCTLVTLRPSASPTP